MFTVFIRQIQSSLHTSFKYYIRVNTFAFHFPHPPVLAIGIFTRAMHCLQRQKPPAYCRGLLQKEGNLAATYSPGSVDQVPLAQGGLTAVFGMGTGVALQSSPPEFLKSRQRPPHRRPWETKDSFDQSCLDGWKKACVL